MLLSRFVVGILSAGMMVLGAGVVSSQDYPNKPIRIISPPVGGGGDFVARLIAQGISVPLGQPVIVENRMALLAAEAVSKAPPDGYTLLVGGGGIWITALLRKMPYDMLNDFSPITMITREVNVLIVHPSVPAKSVKELIALAKARPGELNYGSSGTGSSFHLAAELFRVMAGINILHVPYKGAALAITSLLGGETQLTITGAGSVAGHIKAGRLRAVAVTSAQPSALFPGLPTVASDLPGFEAVGVAGIWATAKTPGTIIKRLNEEVVKFIRTAEAKETFSKRGSEVVGDSPEQLAAFVKSDIARMGKVIKDAGIKAE